MELLGALPLAKLSRDGGSLDDLDAVRTDPVTRSHLSVHLFNSTVQSGVTVLLVHIVVTGSTLVPQPYTVVLDGGGALLKNLQKSKVINNQLKFI